MLRLSGRVGCWAGIIIVTVMNSASGQDECNTAVAIADGVHVWGANATASVDPDCEGNEDEDVWFAWTAGNTGNYRIDTCSSDPLNGEESDTVLTIYGSCGDAAAGNCLATAEDECAPPSGGSAFLSDLVLNGVNAGDVLLIRVSDWRPDGGPDTDPLDPGVLTITLTNPPGIAGNFCEDALPIEGDGQFAWNGGVYLDSGYPNCEGSEDEDVWFRWTATCSGDVVIDTCSNDPNAGQEDDTVLTVYTSCAAAKAGGPCIAFGDDECAPSAGGQAFLSQVTLNVQAGDEYLIRVSDWASGFSDPDPLDAGILTIRTVPHVTQLSWVDDGGLPIALFSDHGQMHLSAAPGDEILWFNAVVDGAWVIQNAPLIDVDGPGVCNEYIYDFQITPVSGTPVGMVDVVHSVTPDQLSLPPIGTPLPLPVAEHFYNEGAGMGEPVLNPVYITPPPAENVVNPPNLITWSKVRRRGVPGVSVHKNHCTPGAVARSLAWMDDIYCLGLPNGNQSVTQIYDKLRNAQHMMTTEASGTRWWSRAADDSIDCDNAFWGKLKAGLDKFITDKNLGGKLTVECNLFKTQDAEDPDFTPCDLFDDLKAGKDVVLNWASWPNGNTTVNSMRGVGHSITVVGAVKCGEEVRIFYRDDVGGDDSQGDGQADTGVKTAVFKAGGTSGWTIKGKRWEGWVAICPTFGTLIDAIFKWTDQLFMALLDVEDAFENGMEPDPLLLQEIQKLSAKLLDVSCALVESAQGVEMNCPGVLSQAQRIKTKAIRIQLASEFLREEPSTDTLNTMLANLNGIPPQLSAIDALLVDCAGFAIPYCATSPNSVGPGAVINAEGSPVVSDNELILTATGAPPSVFGIFYFGPQQFSIPFGDGIRCVGGGVFRLAPPAQADAGGNFVRPVDLTAPPAQGNLVAGSTWNLQCWYRDAMGPGGSGFNLSDAIQILFQ